MSFVHVKHAKSAYAILIKLRNNAPTIYCLLLLCYVWVSM